MSVDVGVQARDMQMDFIRVSCHTLAMSVRDEALGWVSAISQTMREVDTTALAQLRDRWVDMRLCVSVCLEGGK